MVPLFERGVPRKLLIGQAVWTAAWAACTILAAFVLRPSPRGHGTHTQLGLPPCPSILLFGRPCPGCGLTTSWARLLHGDVAGAFAAHPLGPPVYAVFTASAVACAVGFARKTRLNSGARAVNGTVLAFIAVYLAFGLWRFAAFRP